MNYPFMMLTLAFAMMTALWPISVWLKDVSIVDILWAPAFAVITWVNATITPIHDARAWIVLALVSIWALRLGSHVFQRWLRLKHEDYRYAAIRKRHGPNFPLTSLFWIFWLQALLLWVISWPLQAIFAHTMPLGWLDCVGIALAMSGIVIEAVSDVQLTKFRANPQNYQHVLEAGLWAWSRHPNYFGDFIMWWGYLILSLASGGAWWLVFSPIVMSALLIHYSGVGLMEDTIKDRRPGYVEYVRRTSSFILWPPRHHAR